MRRVCGVAVLLMIVWTGGCSDRPRSRVYGKVTHHKKPLAGVIVTFFGSDNQTYTADTNADGAYEVAGVPRGMTRISVQIPPVRPKPRPDPVPGKANELARAEDVAKAARLPAVPPPAAAKPDSALAKYESPTSSELTVDINEPEQKHDIELN